MDESYQTYLNRVAKLTLPATYHGQLQNIQESPKFQDGKPVPFPGYTTNSPCWRDDRDNDSFYHPLQAFQDELTFELKDLISPVPPESFHLTLADLIWDNAYRDAVAEDQEFEQKLCDRLGQSFRNYQEVVSKRSPISLQILGSIVRPRAIALALVPRDEESYQKLLQLRRAIYQNAGLIALGIEQQYPYTAHITLCYFSEIPIGLDRDNLCKNLAQSNDRWMGTDQILTVSQAELHQFDDMTHFYRQPHFPTVEL